MVPNGIFQATSPVFALIAHSSPQGGCALHERDIFTKGDAANPTHKGALFRYMNAYTYDTLAPQASTTLTKLDGQQEIYFGESGEGTVTAGGQTALFPDQLTFLRHIEVE